MPIVKVTTVERSKKHLVKATSVEEMCEKAAAKFNFSSDSKPFEVGYAVI